jgi:hypothetical protein
MQGKFSADNYETVSTSGQVVELMGGADQPGGVTAAAQGLVAEGTFVAQQIGLNGLPTGALEAAMSVPDLAFTLDLADYTNPIWNLHFSGQAGAFEVTLNYAEYTDPIFSKSRLVLYHYNDSGTWERVAGQILDTHLNTVRYTNPEFSPFLLAVSVPEPSAFLLAAAGAVPISAAAVRVRGRRKSGRAPRT